MKARAFGSIGGAWRALDLLRQFLVIASTIFLIGMGVIGAQLSQRIEKGVVQNSAISTALYFESFVEPLIQELANRDTLSEEKRTKFDALINNTALTERVVSFKIWVAGGRIVYASKPDLIGKKFPATPKMKKAWQGHVSASIEGVSAHDDSHEAHHSVPLLEVYVPIRQEHTEKIIAVAEFYENAEKLSDDVFQAQMESWAMIGGLAFITIVALYGIVSRGSITISQQRGALQERIQQLSMLLQQNDQLRKEVLTSSRMAADINEGYLRRFGAELHDGPAQLLGLALLRLDSVGSSRCVESQAGEIEQIRQVLKESLDEIRNLSAGLSLPELEPLTLDASVATAVRAHRQRTGTTVELDIVPLPEPVPHVIKSAAYRIVQEGLNNATRHGLAKGQRVKAFKADSDIVIEVHDSGPGFEIASINGALDQHHLGLVGLRERVQSLNGSIEILSCPESGTLLRARIPCEMEEENSSA